MVSKKIKKYEDLRIWQAGHDLTLKIYKVSSNFPRDEMFGLTSQLRRSSSSVPANIVEGYYRNKTKEFVKFLYTSRGSAGEVTYFLLLAKDLGYISDKEYKSLREEYKKLLGSINALINSLNKK